MKTLTNTTKTIAFLVSVLWQTLLIAGSPSGVVIGWGSNVSGNATGVPYAGLSTGVVEVTGQIITNAVAIAAGDQHALALRSDGTVVGWGANRNGKATGSASTDYPYRASGVVIIDGHVLSNIIKITASRTYSQALKDDGTAISWGTLMNGGKICLALGLSGGVAIAAGMDNSLGLNGDGTLVSAGRNVPAGLSNIVAIAVSDVDYGDDLALKKDGTVVEWGRNGIGTPAPNQATNVIAIASGRWQKLALKRDGTVFAWGYYTNLLPGLTNVVAISVGDSHSLALKRDGTVVGWGLTDRLSLGVPAGLSNVVAIAAGDDFSLAITTNRAVADKFRH